MNHRELREKKMLHTIGISFMNDASLPINTRIYKYRGFLREYRNERIKAQMERFREVNGFDPTDDDAKRKLVDELYYEVFQRYPKDDDERNKYTYSYRRIMNMMMIGWKPIMV
jgi:hypothetical protein